MITTYIHNLTLFHMDHDDLLDHENECIHKTLSAVVDIVQKNVSNKQCYNQMAYLRLDNQNYLLVYANSRCGENDKQPTFLLYNAQNQKMFQTFPFKKLKPLLDESRQEKIKKDVQQMFSKPFPDYLLPKRIVPAIEQEAQETVVHRSCFTGWDSR